MNLWNKNKIVGEHKAPVKTKTSHPRSFSAQITNIASAVNGSAAIITNGRTMTVPNSEANRLNSPDTAKKIIAPT